MSAEHHHVDHSTTLQRCMLQLVATDTADLTFVVGPGVDSHNRRDMLNNSPLAMADVG